MQFMEHLRIFDHRTAKGTSLRLRKELEETEWDDIIRTRLKWGVAPGPDQYPTDMIKTMSTEEKEILRLWINEILTTGRYIPRNVKAETRNGTIVLLHKNGDTTDKSSDWRPVVLLNTLSQLVDHVLESRLRRIVEQCGILEPGQSGYRHGRSMRGHRLVPILCRVCGRSLS